MVRAHVLACLVGSLSACARAPAGTFTAASREDPACGAELRTALEAVRTDLGLGFEVADADAALLGASGVLEKSYTRDATQFTAEFGLELGDVGVCTLRLWTMTERRPGWTRTTPGNYAARLGVCKCS